MPRASPPWGSAAAPAEIAVPSGNRNLARGHATTACDAAGPLTLTLPWRVQPDDRTASYVELWLPEGATDVTVGLHAPGTEAAAAGSVALAEGVPQILRSAEPGIDPAKTVIARLSLDSEEPGRKRVFVALAPTASRAEGRSLAPSGLWQLTLTARMPATGGRIDAWILRDDTPPGFPARGRQSYFDDPAYERFDGAGDLLDTDPAAPGGVVRRAGTLNGLATSPGRIVVGGHRFREQRDRPACEGTWPAPYAATARAPEAVTVAAPSDSSRVFGGVIAAGTRSGTRVAMNGTSVAVPQAVRRLAEARATGDTGSGVAILAAATAHGGAHGYEARAGAGFLPAHPDLTDGIDRFSRGG